MSDKHGMVWWSELMTRDVDAAKKYYADVCGYTFSDMPMPDGTIYSVGMRGEVPTVGVMDMTGIPEYDQTPPHWFTYIAVDDVDAALEQTRAGGGQVITEPFEIPDTGRIAKVSDPSGAVIGLMTPEPMPGD